MADKKDPQERMADAFERIADELGSIAYRIEEHADNLNNFATGFWEVARDIERAMRGEPREEER